MGLAPAAPLRVREPFEDVPEAGEDARLCLAENWLPFQAGIGHQSPLSCFALWWLTFLIWAPEEHIILSPAVASKRQTAALPGGSVGTEKWFRRIQKPRFVT